MGLICLVLALTGNASPNCPLSRIRKQKYEANLTKNKKYEANLTSYASACQEDPELKSFDSSLQLRTSKFITSLAPRAGQNEENLPLNSLMKVCVFLHDLSHDVARIILDNKEDVWKNEELKCLVDLYFEGTSKTLSFFNTVENCVKKAESRLLNFRLAIKKYETESEFGGNMPNKYAETLENLNKATNMGDPFGDDFAKQYKSVRKEHVMILEKIGQLQVELEKKQKNAKKWRIVVNAIFATALLSLFALSVVLSAHHPVAHNVASGLTKSLGQAGTWVNGMMSNRDEALERQIQLLLSAETHTKVNIESMNTIEDLVKTLQSQIVSILQTVEVAVQNREEEAMKLVMQKIIKEVQEFADQIEFVGKEVASCSKCVVAGKVRVLKHMTS